MKRLVSMPTLAALIVVGLALAGGYATPPVVRAATITVTTTDDVLSNDGFCSLREAIINANDNAQTWTNCAAGTGDDLIVLGSGLFDLDIVGAGEDLAATGDLDITDSDNLTIQGAGQNATIIDADDLDRVFEVTFTASGATVIFMDLTITDGSAGISPNGGGIYSTVLLLDLQLERVTVSDNDACGDGGGIYNEDQLTITDSLIENNSAGVCFTDGGGIYNVFGDVVIQGTTIRENHAVGSGGGIWKSGGSLTITDSLIELNTADGFGDFAGQGGGGIWAAKANVDITGSTIRLNHTDVVDKVVTEGAGGGGIYVAVSTLNISDSEILQNTVDASNLLEPAGVGLGGGGIYSNGSQVDITGTTIQDNDVFTPAFVNGGMGEGGGGIYAVRNLEVLTALQLNPAACTLCIAESWIDGNLAGFSDGGGLYVGFGESLSLIRSTVSNNEATAPLDDNSGYGGGLYLGGFVIIEGDGSAYIENSTFSGNIADDAGGAIYMTGGTEAELRFVTISDNEAPEAGAIGVGNEVTTLLTFLATIIGNSTTPGGGSVDNCEYEVTTTVTSLGYSIEDQDTCLLDHPTDDVNTALLLLALADNGGPAPTHALQLVSPALDFVEQGCPPPPTDERGIERPQDGDEDGTALCDAGAYELLGEVFDLTITKICPNGAGDGDADFNILVTQLEDTIAADALDCNEVMVVEALQDGIYTLRELITGPDANNFLTAIICINAEGTTVTPGLLANVELDDDTACQVTNVLQAGVGGEQPGAPGLPPGSVIVPIDLDNTNTNTLNNDNLNDNNNENTNTQEQSNEQTQTNDNNQTTTVDSSPSVVIDFD